VRIGLAHGGDHVPASIEEKTLGGRKPLKRLADEIGYESASAFTTAFRRRHGSAPGAFARQREPGSALA